MATHSDYYQLMGVANTATPDEIKRAHRKLARKYHPDLSKAPDAEAKFKELGQAYEVLKDPAKRAAYDRYGEHWQEAERAEAHASTRSPSGARQQSHRESTTSEQDDLFEQLFRQGFAQQGQDRHARIEIALEDTYTGAARRLVLAMPTLSPDGRMSTEERTLEFKVPVGIRAGQHIRLAGQGWPGSQGAAAGDLFLDVAFLPHPLYRLDKTDVLLDLPISPWEAALGAQLEVPTPAGRVSLTIPPGSGQGKKLRLKGKGIPSREPGDFYFVLSLVTPPVSSEADGALFRQMADHFKHFNPRAHLGATP